MCTIRLRKTITEYIFCILLIHTYSDGEEKTGMMAKTKKMWINCPNDFFGAKIYPNILDLKKSSC